MSSVVINRFRQFAICNLQFAICNIFLIGFFAFLFFFRLGSLDLWSSHEARAAMDGRSVLDAGFTQFPHLYDGQPELQKPPLYYWLVALAGKTTGGVDAWAVRLPAALAGLAGVLLLYGFLARRGRPVAGLVAATVLATAFHYTTIARTGRVDIPLTLTTAAALLAFYLVWQGGSRRWLVPAYLAVALGMLFKGPLGGVLPIAVAGIWLLLNGALPRPWRIQAWLRMLHEYGVWWGMLLVCLIVAPVYLWADTQTDGEFSRVFLWHHNVERGFGGSEVLRAHPWWFYFPRFAFDFLPWTPALPVSAWFLVKRFRRADREARFGVVWLIAIFLLMSAMRFKRSDYLLPAFPGAALFLGCMAEQAYRVATRRRWLALGLGVMLAGCGVGWAVYLEQRLPAEEPERECVRFASQIREYAPTPDEVQFFRTENHALAFRVGRPLTLFVEWDRLDDLAARPEPSYIVMTEKVACEWPQFLKKGWLEEIARNTDLPGAVHHEKPMVLFRTHPVLEPTASESHARAGSVTSDGRPAN
jgi:4-amino-4-deoxy-L-arabinose transferase-like glycosyltransferase